MSIITKFVRFGLSAELFGIVRMEARRQKISVSELIRRALKQYINGARLQQFTVTWTRAEEEYADKVLQEHFDEDRNETIRLDEIRNRQQ